jgi:hypothetical protein
MQLIYLSPVSWSSFAQRSHKFVSWFHTGTGGDVLWIDPYPTRFPLISDFRQLSSRANIQNLKKPSWIRVITPSALPIEPLPGSDLANAFLWRSILKMITDFSQQKTTLLTIGKPSLLALIVLKRLNGIISFYDAMDDFPAFYTGFSRWAMYWRERRLACNVTGILASSTMLSQRWSALRTNVQLVHNAFDPEVMPVRKNITTQKEKKILGYVGTIGSWFDWKWIAALAEARPTDVVKLIGPVFTPAPCELPKNIVSLPPCSQQEALHAMQDFDVGLIPFKRTELTAAVDPIKYYEYRALYLPVLSTCFGEMALRQGQSGVFLTNKHSELSRMARAAIASKCEIKDIQQFRTVNSWKARFDAAGILP